ncbi:hypothetical protein [Pleurocapsa sp. PCC 7319]|uniref:hypothetical protein n=1 Tax=Pleurocapsa sp. PCC 7319 TaxID=118161 RepID=UPI000348429A|nr:hypothetical protein [Pleurocapsa sp. PCC 7319]
MSYIPQPPFLVALLGIFVSITCGLAFKNLIENKLAESYKNPRGASSFKLDRVKDVALTMTYWGICLGIWVFLGGGLLILGFGIIPSYGVGLFITLFTASLFWQQIDEVLLQLKEGGSKALELD